MCVAMVRKMYKGVEYTEASTKMSNVYVALTQGSNKSKLDSVS